MLLASLTWNLLPPSLEFSKRRKFFSTQNGLTRMETGLVFLSFLLSFRSLACLLVRYMYVYIWRALGGRRRRRTVYIDILSVSPSILASPLSLLLPSTVLSSSPLS